MTLCWSVLTNRTIYYRSIAVYLRYMYGFSCGNWRNWQEKWEVWEAFVQFPYKESLLYVCTYGSQHICFILKRGEGCKYCGIIAISSTGWGEIRYFSHFQKLQVGRLRAYPGRFGWLRRMKAKMRRLRSLTAIATINRCDTVFFSWERSFFFSLQRCIDRSFFYLRSIGVRSLWLRFVALPSIACPHRQRGEKNLLDLWGNA